MAANGDVASVLLFGSFGVYALFDMWSAHRRGQRPSDEKQPLLKDLTVVAVGVILYVLLLRMHGLLFGAPLV